MEGLKAKDRIEREKYMRLVIIGLGVFYGVIMVLTGGMMLTQKKLGRLSSVLMLAGGALITYTFLDKDLVLYTREGILAAGLIGVHISAIMNGFKLYGKPLVKHHIIRACISIGLMAGNYWLYNL